MEESALSFTITFSSVKNTCWEKKVKDGEGRLMGFGHRVYKSYDPRAKVMKETCDEVLAELGLADDPQLKIAKRLEQIARTDGV